MQADVGPGSSTGVYYITFCNVLFLGCHSLWLKDSLIGGLASSNSYLLMPHGNSLKTGYALTAKSSMLKFFETVLLAGSV